MYCTLPMGTASPSIIATFSNDPDGLLVSTTKYLISYAAATVTYLASEGCDDTDNNNALNNCPREGGVTITYVQNI